MADIGPFPTFVVLFLFSVSLPNTKCRHRSVTVRVILQVAIWKVVLSQTLVFIPTALLFTSYFNNDTCGHSSTKQPFHTLVCPHWLVHTRATRDTARCHFSNVSPETLSVFRKSLLYFSSFCSPHLPRMTHFVTLQLGTSRIVVIVTE